MTGDQHGAECRIDVRNRLFVDCPTHGTDVGRWQVPSAGPDLVCSRQHKSGESREVLLRGRLPNLERIPIFVRNCTEGLFTCAIEWKGW